MTPTTHELDVLIVGAGFSGMYLIYKMRELGLNALVLEAAPEVGGTWYFNRYPGARCDVESMEYSYSFSEELQKEWNWPQKYSEQNEILEYANHVADRFDLRSHIKFSTKVISAKFDESINMWNIRTDSGDVYITRYFIMATGTLSVPNKPKFEGLDSFKGEWYMTGNWPHEEPDLKGKKVSGEVEGLHARVMQHEFDHLNGILYTSRLADKRAFGYSEEIEKFWKKNDEDKSK